MPIASSLLNKPQLVKKLKKFYRKQPKFLKFKTHDGEMIEIRGADGLNYRIEEL